MKFDDMKMDKNNNTTDEMSDGAFDEGLEAMKLADFAIGSKIGELFLGISPIGRKPLLCALVESAAKERGITSFEYLDEIRQTIKEVRGDGS